MSENQMPWMIQKIYDQDVNPREDVSMDFSLLGECSKSDFEINNFDCDVSSISSVENDMEFDHSLLFLEDDSATELDNPIAIIENCNHGNNSLPSLQKQFSQKVLKEALSKTSREDGGHDAVNETLAPQTKNEKYFKKNAKQVLQIKKGPSLNLDQCQSSSAVAVHKVSIGQSRAVSTKSPLKEGNQTNVIVINKDELVNAKKRPKGKMPTQKSVPLKHTENKNEYPVSIINNKEKRNAQTKGKNNDKKVGKNVKWKDQMNLIGSNSLKKVSAGERNTKPSSTLNEDILSSHDKKSKEYNKMGRSASTQETEDANHYADNLGKQFSGKTGRGPRHNNKNIGFSGSNETQMDINQKFPSINGKIRLRTSSTQDLPVTRMLIKGRTEMIEKNLQTMHTTISIMLEELRETVSSTMTINEPDLQKEYNEYKQVYDNCKQYWKRMGSTVQSCLQLDVQN